jgi:hypothetical protein
MPAANPLPPPRKLYGTIKAHELSSARTRAVLDFLVRYSACANGWLFLVRGGELENVAGTQPGAPAAELLSEARTIWSRELDKRPEDQRTQTVNASGVEQLMQHRLERPRWTSPDGNEYIHQLLSVYRGLTWLPLGLAMLELRDANFTPLRQPYIEALCNALLDAGDVNDHA